MLRGHLDLGINGMLPFLRRRPSPAIARLKHEQGKQALRYLTVGAGWLYAALFVLHPVMLPQPDAFILMASAGVSALVCFGMRAALHTVSATPDRTRASEAGILLILASNTMAHAYLLPDPSLTTTMSLVVIAAGLCLHSSASMFGTILLGAGGVGYMLMAPGTPAGAIGHYATHFVFSTLLASVIFTVRMNQIRQRAASELRRRRALGRLQRQRALLQATSDRAERAAFEADAANRAKSQFLANMSHELRTPLNAIIGFSELMKHGIFGKLGDSRYGEYADHIHSSGSYLLQLVNDILDLSKIEANKMGVAPEPVQLSEIVGESVAMIDAQAAQRDVNLEVGNVEGDAMVAADPRALQQILLNLLSNAVKFTEPGGHVHISAMPSEIGWRVRVEDTGIGIAPEDIPKILAPFGQVENAMTRTQDGTGLGLPLAKSMTELMNGRFSIESEPGRGTKIYIDLPRSDSEYLGRAKVGAA